MSEYKKWERLPKTKTEGVITTCIAVPSRYIDAEWLCNELGDINMDIYTDEVKKYIDSAPSIDIVRCGECKYDETWKCPWRNTQVPRYPSADDFCSYGERSSE